MTRVWEPDSGAPVALRCDVTTLCQRLPSRLIIWLAALTKMVDQRAQSVTNPPQAAISHPLHSGRLQLTSTLLLQAGHYCVSVTNPFVCSELLWWSLITYPADDFQDQKRWWCRKSIWCNINLISEVMLEQRLRPFIFITGHLSWDRCCFEASIKLQVYCYPKGNITFSRTLNTSCIYKDPNVPLIIWITA